MGRNSTSIFGEKSGGALAALSGIMLGGIKFGKNDSRLSVGGSIKDVNEVCE